MDQFHTILAADPIVLNYLSRLLRFATGGLLIAIAFYLQIIAYDVKDNNGETRTSHPVPLRFRWPPFLLGVLILDRARMGSIIPFPSEVLSVVIYSVFIYLLLFGFGAIMAYYDVPSPRERIPEYVREMLHQLHLR